MDGKPSWAMTLPSQNSTKAWTMLCGCTTTSSASYGSPKRWCASISSSALLARVALSTVILFPMRQVGCRSASLDRRVPHARFGGHSRNGPPGARQDQAAEPAVPPAHALEHRAVLGVDRHQLAAAGARRLGHQVARHHQRFLVGQRDPLPRPERRQRGVEPGGADHRVDHDVHVGMGGGLEQHLRPGGVARPVAAGTRAPA